MQWRPTQPKNPCDWMVELPPLTRCKHGKGPCERCGTTNERDVVHTRRTPTKREARRLRKKKDAR